MTGYPFEWSEPSGRAPAPGRVRTLQQFVNTYNVEDAYDHLATPEAASAWFRSEHLSTAKAVRGEDDLAKVHHLRRWLRELLSDKQPADPLETVLSGLRVEIGFVVDGDGTVDFTMASTNLAAAMGALVLIVRDAQLSGDLNRLRICHADRCRWAYWDHSRNKSSRWCSMELCGNRQKAKRNRQRQASRPIRS